MSTDNRINESDNLSHATFLDQYTKGFIIKDRLCNVKTKTLEIYNDSCIVNLNELEGMNQGWKNRSMISFGASKNRKMIHLYLGINGLTIH